MIGVTWQNAWRQWGAILKGMALLATLLAGGNAHATDGPVIENIASAAWNDNGVAHQARSNRVTIAVLPPPPEIRLFRSDSTAADSLTFTASQCAAAGTPSGAIQHKVVPAAGYRSGQAILFEISARAANRDPAAIDSITAVLTAPNGDRETLTVFETGPDTGVFAGLAQTTRNSHTVAAADCALRVAAGDRVTLTISGMGIGEASRDIAILADPFGVVFDSETASPVSGAIVSLRDAATGALAQVFAEDGVTPWPATVTSGEPITDGAGNIYPMEQGRYWFPLTFLGRYRIEVTPPPPFTAPSAVAPARIALLRRPDGAPFAIADASFGMEFALDGPLPVEIDIPVDRDRAPIALTMAVSRPRVQPGDVVIYSLSATNPDSSGTRPGVTISIAVPRGVRVRGDTIRIDGEPAPDNAVRLSGDGLRLELDLATVAAGGTRRIAYGASIRADTRPGQLFTTAEARDGLARTSRANAAVLVERENLAGRMTIIGRVNLGGCGDDRTASGLGGVRVMMEDGSFAITDADGRYRFEGVVPGTHVVQVARGTVPAGMRLMDCAASTRSAGSAVSRFVTGQGGSLVRADFHMAPDHPAGQPVIALSDQPLSLDRGVSLAGNTVGAAAPPVTAPSVTVRAPGPAAAAPQTSDDMAGELLALGDGPDGWLFPAEDHNPRAPSIKVAVRHRAGQTIRLYVDGKPVGPAAFDGAVQAPGGSFAISLWRGVPLMNERTVLAAEIVNSLGGVNARLEREVFFISQPARAELVPEQSLLIADGVTRPVVVVRLTDRNGRPVREGVSGNFVLSAPFESASQIDLQQIRQLSGIGEASARWVIEGDDGLARIELAPTMVSGQLRIDFDFSNENIRRRQEIEAWIVPGDIEWTIVGLGEATVGARTIADNMERGDNFASDLGRNARVALYAKGRVLGKYLTTLAYDSAKQRDDQPLLGALDPTAYYTVFGDNSQRRFDAATREKLYVRIETATFFALYGDFQTGFDDTVLGRYQRTATGIRTEARLGAVRAEAFGARIGSTFRRDEFQGNGLAGPYPLGSRDILINSERVTIEVRDRLRSEVVVSARSLARFIDYTIDVLSGTITFSEPVVSRDFDLNPQIVIIEYETLQDSGGAINAGARVDWSSADGALRIGANAITDKGEGERSNVGVADLRLRFGGGSEVRGEIGISQQGDSSANAWLVELQHQTGKLDLVAYARSIESDYGIGQQSVAEAGRRKLGLDVRYILNEELTASASALQDHSLDDARQRRGGQVQLAYRTPSRDVRLGLAHFHDRLTTGERAISTLLEAGATQRLMNNRLEASAASSLALNSPQSLDQPARHRFGLRYAITNDIRLKGTYEIAESEAISARTLRGGLEVTPWQGGRVVTTLGQNAGGDTASGQFAGFGVAQTITVSPTLNFNVTVDGNRILGEAPRIEAIINPAQPAANGGPLSVDGTLFEDFTAVTLSGTWRSGRWNANGRAEYRSGQFADRTGAALGIIRQIGEGSSFGGNLVWTRSTTPGGMATEMLDAGFSLAHRPDGSALSLLSRLEYRNDRVAGAVAGEVGPAGRTALLVAGDAQARRLIGSLSANWSPRTRERARQLTEIGLFLAARNSFDRVEALELAGLTALAGLDLRIGVNSWFDLGGIATVRANVTDGSYSYALGPQASMVVADGALLSFGYNFEGFRDPDFSFERATNPGVFAALRFKFDADLLGTGQRGAPRMAPVE